MIFMAGKPCAKSATMKLRSRGQILALAKKFQVTPKTIRDIWNRRTWRNATSRLITDNGVIFGQQAKQHRSGHSWTCLHPEYLRRFSTSIEARFMPDQQAAGAASEMDLEHCNARSSSKTRLHPDVCLEYLERFTMEPTFMQERFAQRPYLHWPGDALLLAAGARSHLDEAGYEELPTQGGVDSAADPFAGDWAY